MNQPSNRQWMPFAFLSASYFAHVGFFNPYLPLWLKGMGLGLVSISLLTSIQSATRMIAPYIWGVISDRTGNPVQLLRYSALVALVVSFALGLNLSFTAMAVVLTLMFTHTSGMMPMSEAATAQWVNRNGMFDSQLYGRIRLWGSLGFLLMVLASGAWFDHFGLSHFPQITALSLLLVVASVFLLPNQRDARHSQAPNQPVWTTLCRPEVAGLFASIFFHVLSHMAIYFYFSLYLDELGYSKALIGLMWAVGVIIEVLFFYTQSRWLPMLDPKTWLVVASAVMALRMVITAEWGNNMLILLAVQALHAITFAAHHSTCIALISAYFPGRLRGRGQALFSIIGYGITGVVGALLGGIISEALGLNRVFWLAAVSAVLGALLAHFTPAPDPEAAHHPN